MRGENLAVILGLKLRHLREVRGYGLKAFSELAGVSPSYLNEIEKGKKYPKADKILQLANALDVPFDEMVSLKLGKELMPLESFLDSPIIQALPLQMFGLAPRDIIDLMSKAPKEVSALIKAVMDIAGSYDMQVEHFFYAMLRSYQETHNNYFEEIESAAESFITAREWRSPVSLESLRGVLETEYGVVVDDTELGNWPDLQIFRSVWIKGNPERLLINPRLTDRQKAFQIGREIGYRVLKLKARGITSSRAEVESFEQVLNDFQASYFSGALMIPQQRFVEDLRGLFASKTWDGQKLLEIMNHYQVTPEMFCYRLTQITPRHFQLKGLHFLRVTHQPGMGGFQVNKQLNMSGPLFPVGLGWNEHYCRRWVAVDLLNTLHQQQEAGRANPPLVAVQKARFLEENQDYFLIALARPLALTPGTNTSVTLGFALDKTFKNTARFWDDASAPTAEMEVTCERCPLSEKQCAQRAVPFRQVEGKRLRMEKKESLERLLESVKSKYHT